MRFVVLGGAGAMGRITIRDLFETAGSQAEVVIADYDGRKAQDLKDQLEKMRKTTSPRLNVAKVDILNEVQTSEVLSGAVCVINCAHYQMNLQVMRACLKANCHYVDLGGLFHTTFKQLELHREFEKAQLTALLGMGAAPGITNILARMGADQLDQVHAIHCRVAGIDQTRYDGVSPLSVSYSLKTILEEFSFEPAVFTKGKMSFVKPMSGAEPMNFPKPIGKVRPMFTIHSEVATLPQSFQSKGVREVSFKIAFDEVFLDRVRFLRDMGLAAHEPITVKGSPVVPIDFINTVAMNLKQPSPKGPLKQYEVVRTIVLGTLHKKKVSIVADCHTRGIPQWGLGLDVDTGCPPSIAAQMIATKQITIRGAVPAELAVPPTPFVRELGRRRMKVTLAKKSGWIKL